MRIRTLICWNGMFRSVIVDIHVPLDPVPSNIEYPFSDIHQIIHFVSVIYLSLPSIAIELFVLLRQTLVLTLQTH
jgi:hypothetical protein